MSERVVAVVEARMGSSRLPGKSMRSLLGVPLVERVLYRVRRARSLDGVVLATSTSPKDDPLAAHVASLGVPVFRGSEDDVLARILGAAREHAATVHVQCWGDCPFADPDQIDANVARLQQTGADLVSNCVGGRSVPHGLEVIAFRREALEAAEVATRGQAYHREHGTTYLYETPSAFVLAKTEDEQDIAFPRLDLTINTAEDFTFVESLYAALLPSGERFGIRDVLALLRERPELLAAKGASSLVELA